MKRYYEILLAMPAVQVIRAIHRNDPVVAKFIVNSLEYLSSDMEPGVLRTIDEAAGLLKATVGNFDALCWIRREEMEIVILTISEQRQPT